MKYWYHYEDTPYPSVKDDGILPVALEAARFVYVAAMNKLLAKHGSEVRVYPWNRGSYYYVSLVPATAFTSAELETWNEHLLKGTLLPENEKRFGERLAACDSTLPVDDAWDLAFQEANALDLDKYVILEVFIPTDFMKLLAGI